MGKHDEFFSALTETQLRMTSKMRILQVCGVGRPMFLLRTHPPAMTTPAAIHFDGQMERCLKQMLGADVQLDDIAALPLSKGGLGLRPVSNLTEIAFLAREKGAQRPATMEYEQNKQAGILSTMTESQRCVMKSYATVDMRNVACSDEAFVVMCRDRLGLPTVHAEMTCKCGEPLDTMHVHTCEKISKIVRHDMIKEAISKIVQRRFVTRVEPSRLVQASRSKPDLLVYLHSGDVWTDITVTHVGRTKDAMRLRAAEKRRKYGPSVGEGASFIPFVIGHTGELEREAEEFLNLTIPSRPERDEARRDIRRVLYEQNLRPYREARM